jgi:hypothetical protein
MSFSKQSPRSLVRPLLLVGAGIILVVAAIVLGTRKAPEPAQIAGDQTPTLDQVGRVSLLDAKKALDRQDATFIDVRNVQDYNDSHIPGSLSMPTEELAVLSTELDPNDWILTYCT